MIHRVATLLVAVGVATIPVLAQQVQSNDPVTGYVGPTTYSNAHYGFAIEIPKSAAVNVPPRRDSSGIIFSYQLQSPCLTVLIIAIKPGVASGGKDAKSALDGQEGKLQKKSLGGQDVWEKESSSRTSGGKMQVLTLTTEIQGQVLRFALTSFDNAQFEQSKQGLEQIKFFDPSKAKEMAGVGVDAVPLEPKQSSSIGLQDLSPGVMKDGSYRNEQLGFSFATPQGWTQIDAAKQKAIVDAGHRAVHGTDPDTDAEHTEAIRCSKNLVWVVGPADGPEAAPDSSVVLQAFDMHCLPGMNFPKDTSDQAGLNDLAKSMKNLMTSEDPHGIEITGAGLYAATASHA